MIKLHEYGIISDNLQEVVFITEHSDKIRVTIRSDKYISIEVDGECSLDDMTEVITIIKSGKTTIGWQI